MAGRQAHGRAPDKKPRVKNNSKKRALDAFAIASHQTSTMSKSENIDLVRRRVGIGQENGAGAMITIG